MSVTHENSSTSSALHEVRARLEAFKRKFYLSLLVRGALVAGGLLLSLFLVLNLLEYFLYLPTWVRGGLLFGFLGLAGYAFMRWIWQPLAALTNLRRLLSDEQAAQRIGQLFPDVQDKLLNALQLQDKARGNALIAASLEQRAGQLAGVQFENGINIRQQTRPLWKFVAVPAGVIMAVLLIYPAFFVQGTRRILNYRQKYSPPAPFRFIIENKDLTAFQGEDFKLQVKVEGQAIPNDVTIEYGGRERHLVQDRPGHFSYQFQQLQKGVQFQLAAADVTSEDYDLTLRQRPNLRDFQVDVTYPAYLGKPAETIRNTGNLTVPEGSTVRWRFATQATDQLQLLFKSPDEVHGFAGGDAHAELRRAPAQSGQPQPGPHRIPAHGHCRPATRNQPRNLPRHYLATLPGARRQPARRLRPFASAAALPYREQGAAQRGVSGASVAAGGGASAVVRLSVGFTALENAARRPARVLRAGVGQ